MVTITIAPPGNDSVRDNALAASIVAHGASPLAAYGYFVVVDTPASVVSRSTMRHSDPD